LVISYWLSLGFYFLFVLGERSTIRAILFALISIFRVFFSFPFFPFSDGVLFSFWWDVYSHALPLRPRVDNS
jgi:fumarate reductase subunit C